MKISNSFLPCTYLKVFIAIPCLYRGGTEIQTLNLAKTLISFGHSVTVVCYFENNHEVVKEFKREGIYVELMNLERSINPFKFILLLYNFFNINNPDIIHIQYMSPGALPIIAARLSGVKTIFATVHQPWTKSHGLFSKLILIASSYLCTRFMAVSPYAEKSWFGNCHLFDEDKPLRLQSHHLTIYNSIDIERIQKIKIGVNTDSLKRTLSIATAHMIIGAVSRLRYEKGIELLIEAFNILIKNGSQIHLLVVGTGPDELKLKEKVSELGISKSVTFIGEAAWERAIQLIAIMDIVVTPSRFEGFGLTAAEAMSLGKPVVVSDTSGLKEVVTNEVSGILFPVGDREALKSAMERLVKDPDLRESFGKAGIERVKSNFSLDLYRKKIKALYNI